MSAEPLVPPAPTDRPGARLELSLPGGRSLVPLVPPVVTVGRAEANAIVLPGDGQVSALHAVLQTYGAWWAIKDLGSTNGTVVAGTRLTGERVLRPGDEIRVGRTRMVFLDAVASPVAATDKPAQAPEVTRREREVLVELCRPLFSGDPFSEPASVRDMAAALVVTEAAVKQHLSRLYDKFGVLGGRRRLALANEAVLRGGVEPHELA